MEFFGWDAQSHVSLLLCLFSHFVVFTPFMLMILRLNSFTLGSGGGPGRGWKSEVFLFFPS
jgi:hypothetical protein